MWSKRGRRFRTNEIYEIDVRAEKKIEDKRRKKTNLAK